MVKARVDETIRRLDLIRRDEFDAISELAANARAGQEAAEARLAEVSMRLSVLEARLSALETAPRPSGDGR